MITVTIADTSVLWGCSLETMHDRMMKWWWYIFYCASEEASLLIFINVSMQINPVEDGTRSALSDSMGIFNAISGTPGGGSTSVLWSRPPHPTPSLCPPPISPAISRVSYGDFCLHYVREQWLRRLVSTFGSTFVLSPTLFFCYTYTGLRWSSDAASEFAVLWLTARHYLYCLGVLRGTSVFDPSLHLISFFSNYRAPVCKRVHYGRVVFKGNKINRCHCCKQNIHSIFYISLLYAIPASGSRVYLLSWTFERIIHSILGQRTCIDAV